MPGQSHADQRSKDVMQNQQSYADKKSKDVMKSYSGRTVKLSEKAREALTQDPWAAEKRPEVENLIFHLTKLLNSWDTNEIEKKAL